jgi:hypothetical protein
MERHHRASAPRLVVVDEDASAPLVLLRPRAHHAAGLLAAVLAALLGAWVALRVLE